MTADPQAATELAATRAAPARREARLAAATAFGLAAAVGCALLAWRTLPDVGVPPRAAALRGAEALMFEPTGNSPPIVFAATVWLLWRRWPRLRAALGCPPWRVTGAVLFAASALLTVWSHYVAAPSLLLPAITCGLLGAAYWLGGAPAARAVLLPACFVLVAFPIPAALINQFMYPLQLFTAATVTAALDAVGLPTSSQADLIFRQGAIFQVIESCSGVRTIETIIMSALLFHDLFFRSVRQSWLLLLLAPLVGLVANLLRVVGIVLNPYSKFAAVHTAQGLVMIAIAVVLLALVDSLLTRVVPAEAPGRRLRIVSATPLPSARAFVVAAAFGLLALATFALRPWSAPPVQETPLSAFPTQIEGYEATPLKLDAEFYGSTSFSEWVRRRYERDGAWVEILLGSDRRLDPFVSPVSRKAAIPGPGYEVERRETITLDGGRVAERLLVESRDREVVYRWYQGVESPLVEVSRALLSLDRSPFRRPGRALVVRLSTLADADADARLRDFARATEAAIATQLPDTADPR